MGILDDDLASVRERVDLAALVAAHVSLKKVGRRLVGLCPFHSENTPSFTINPELGVYHCFGCGKGGDAITFVREVEQLDFVAAVERLAGTVGIELRYDDRDGGAGRARRAGLVDALARAAEWYHTRLVDHPDGDAVRAYLAERGVTDTQITEWRIGWAPSGDHLAAALGVADDVWVGAGLGWVDDTSGAQRDGFRARVMFPIADHTGTVIGFGGRILPGGPGPKYRNSPEGPLYAKSRVLFGLDRAKAAAVRANRIVVAEGYTDVIALAAAGITEVVATCGTALTDDHVRILRRYTPNIVMALDGDAAGQAAVARLAGWETRHGVRLAVAEFPAGADPADVATTSPDTAAGIVDGARPFLTFQIDRLLATADLGTPEDRARAATDAAALVASHPDELVRDTLLMSIAERCRVDVSVLRRQARSRRPEPLVDEPAPSPDNAAAIPAGQEALLNALVHHRDAAQALIDPVLVTDPVARSVVDALAGGLDTARAALADTPAGAVLDRVAASEPVEDPADVVAAATISRLGRFCERITVAVDADRLSPLDAIGEVSWAKTTIDRLANSTPAQRDMVLAGIITSLAERVEGLRDALGASTDIPDDPSPDGPADGSSAPEVQGGGVEIEAEIEAEPAAGVSDVAGDDEELVF